MRASVKTGRIRRVPLLHDTHVEEHEEHEEGPQEWGWRDGAHEGADQRADEGADEGVRQEKTHEETRIRFQHYYSKRMATKRICTVPYFLPPPSLSVCAFSAHATQHSSVRQSCQPRLSPPANKRMAPQRK